MFTIQNFSDLENFNLFIPNNIVSLSYTDLTKNDPSFPHSHQYTEIMIVADGNGELMVEQQRIPFTKGKLYFINPNTEHLETSDRTLKYYVAKINHFTLKSLTADQYSSVFILNIDYSTMQNILTRFMQVMKDSEIKGNQRKTLLSLELSYLYYYFIHVLDNHYSIEQNATQVVSSKIQAVTNYISANYGAELKVPEIAQKFSFSHNNLIYHFKKELGMSPSEYITTIRIQAAKNLLKNSDFAITQIATLCGFSNSSFFGKTFKSVVGISPSEYRTKNK